MLDFLASGLRFLGFKVQGFGFRGSGLNEGAGLQNVHVQFMAWDEVGLWEVEHTHFLG